MKNTRGVLVPGKAAVFLLAACLLLAATVAAFADDWPCWRGPRGDGIYPARDWSPTAIGKPKKLWSVNVGRGFSAVSVKNGKLYTMGHDGRNNVVYCLDAGTGKEVWKQSYPCWNGGGYAGSRGTPVVDEGRVYTFSQQGQLHCFDAASGKLEWSKDLAAAFGARRPSWGMAASVRVHDGLVLVNAGKAGMAFDKKSGRKVWSNGGGTGGYATPVILKQGSKNLVAIFAQKEVVLLDPKSGRRAWGFPWVTSYDVNAADPLLVGKDRLFISSGYGRGCAMLSLSGKKLWENKNMNCHFSSPIYRKGYIYGVNGNTGRGVLSCISAVDGSKKWEQRMGAEVLLGAGDKLLVLTKGGELVVAKAQPKGYKEISRCRAIAPRKHVWTIPVLADGKVYCRNGAGDLVCIDAGK